MPGILRISTGTSLIIVALISVVVVCMHLDLWYGFVVIFMLALPLLDRVWLREGAGSAFDEPMWVYAAVTVVAVVITFLLPVDERGGWLRMILMTAVPEEFFFRAYMQSRLGNDWRANLWTSSLFAAVHVLSRMQLVAVLVFLPSLVFGAFYSRTRSLVLVISLHALSNLAYALLGIGDYLSSGDLLPYIGVSA